MTVVLPIDHGTVKGTQHHTRLHYSTRNKQKIGERYTLYIKQHISCWWNLEVKYSFLFVLKTVWKIIWPCLEFELVGNKDKHFSNLSPLQPGRGKRSSLSQRPCTNWFAFYYIRSIPAREPKTLQITLEWFVFCGARLEINPSQFSFSYSWEFNFYCSVISEGQKAWINTN